MKKFLLVCLSLAIHPLANTMDIVAHIKGNPDQIILQSRDLFNTGKVATLYGDGVIRIRNNQGLVAILPSDDKYYQITELAFSEDGSLLGMINGEFQKLP